MQFHEGISSGNLKAGRIGRGPPHLFYPSIHKLTTNREAAIDIPYDVGRGEAAFVVSVFWLKGGILDLQPPEGRTGSDRLVPEVLVTDPGSESGQCF